jgi:hypothetical protein
VDIIINCWEADQFFVHQQLYFFSYSNEKVLLEILLNEDLRLFKNYHLIFIP